MARTTLTKSLHTVTVVAKLAATAYNEATNDGYKTTPAQQVKNTLKFLGLDGTYTKDDVTFVACVAAATKLTSQVSKRR